MPTISSGSQDGSNTLNRVNNSDNGQGSVVTRKQNSNESAVDNISIIETTNGYSINFTNANTWIGIQTFPIASIPNITLNGPLVSSIVASNGLAVVNPTGVGSATYSIVLNGTSLLNSSIGLSLNPIINYTSVTSNQATATTPTAIVVGASPFTYTNTTGINQNVFIIGGVITGITYNSLAINIGISQIILKNLDSIVITYTTAPTSAFVNS